MDKVNFHDDMVRLGVALRILRKRKNLTQDDIAKMAGIDRKHLSDLELGKHKVGLELTLLLCQALGVRRFELCLRGRKSIKFTGKRFCKKKLKNSVLLT